MEDALADDESFRNEVKKLEEMFGQELIGAGMRERFHLEKAHLYNREINSNLEDAMRQLQETRLITGETADLLKSDTEKLRKAFIVVGKLKQDFGNQIRYHSYRSERVDHGQL